MTRSKLSTKVVLLSSAIGLSWAAFAGSQPAAAQSYSDEYNCPAGFVYDPTYGCTLSRAAYEPYDYGYGAYYGGHREFGHGFGHGMAGGVNQGVGFAHVGGHGFGHGMGGGFHRVGFAHVGGGGFGHGMGGGFHGGGGGHR